MKRMVLLLIVLLMLFSLCSCVTVKRNVDFLQDTANIQRVAIYHSDIAYHEGNISGFLEENEPIAIVDEQEQAAFLKALSKLKFEKGFLLIPIPMDGGCDYEGYIIAVTYSDGSYDIIAEEGLYSYAVGTNGKDWHRYDYSDYVGKTPWVDFIERYLGEVDG